MTLREEIKNIIYSEVTATDSRDIDGEVEAADEILKLFEKMIDSIDENKEELDYQNGWSGDDEFWDGYELGFEQAFKLMKEELKK